jgi:hypothetical protein
MTDEHEGCDWKEQRLYLNKTLDRIDSTVQRIEQNQSAKDAEIYNRLNKLQIAEAQLRVKSGAWGLVGSGIAALIAFVWMWISGNTK